MTQEINCPICACRPCVAPLRVCSQCYADATAGRKAREYRRPISWSDRSLQVGIAQAVWFGLGQAITVAGFWALFMLFFIYIFEASGVRVGLANVFSPWDDVFISLGWKQPGPIWIRVQEASVMKEAIMYAANSFTLLIPFFAVGFAWGDIKRAVADWRQKGNLDAHSNHTE